MIVETDVIARPVDDNVVELDETAIDEFLYLAAALNHTRKKERGFILWGVHAKTRRTSKLFS